jgi:putative transposase
MIDRTHALPLTRQAEVLKLSRSSLYYQPRPVSPRDLAVMRRIDELHLDYPFAGSRMLRGMLEDEGIEIGRQRVITMMRRMGIEAIYRRPNTSKATSGNKIYPYLLRGVLVDRPNQVWAMDITYIPMARGFVYLAAVIDWFSRRVLAWRVSIDMAVDFCLEAVEEAIARHGTPRRDCQDFRVRSGMMGEKESSLCRDARSRRSRLSYSISCWLGAMLLQPSIRGDCSIL